MFRSRLSLFLLPILLLACGLGEAWGCPTCKDNVAANGQNLVQGYFWSILFMMSMPFLLLGGLGGYFYLEVRRARRKQEQPAQDLIASK